MLSTIVVFFGKELKTGLLKKGSGEAELLLLLKGGGGEDTEHE